jgi:hypothetical protein
MLKQSSKHFFLMFICLGFFLPSFSQGNKNIVGRWKGMSICQVKNSSCHDENVIYHISARKAPDSFYIQANKIVNGVEEDMGTLAAVYDTAKHLLTAHYREDDIWEFKINGEQMNGTLVYNKALYRIIKLKKEN